MRICCLAVLLLVACGDDTMSSSTQDMAVAMNPDLSVTFGTQTCLQVASCASGCSGMATCLANCASKGTQQAQMKYQALGACALGVCQMKPDGGGAAPCSSAQDMPQGCIACVTTAAQGPDCQQQLATCLSDK